MSFTGMREMGSGEDRQLKVWAFINRKTRGSSAFFAANLLLLLLIFGEMTKITLWIVRGCGGYAVCPMGDNHDTKKGNARRTKEGSPDLES